MWCRPLPVLLLGVGLAIPVGAPLHAQQDSTPILKVTACWPSDRFRDADELIELTLDRALNAGETLALVIGTLDVTHLTDGNGTRVRYRPNKSALGAGESPIAVYVVRNAKWSQVASLSIKVRNRLGLDEGRVLPTVDVNSAGQLAQGGNAAPTGGRERYQDLTLRVGAESNLTRDAWRIALQANTVGVSREDQRLQYETLQGGAPQFDLSDYKAELTRGMSKVQIGNLSASNQKMLLDGFSSRGIGGTVQVGPRATVNANVMNGTNAVGWSNALGISRSEHRLTSAALSLEMIPSRPGGFHVAVTGLDGSVLPIANFNQGSVTDAEQSTGYGGQLGLSNPSERIKFTGGLARSRFTNPVDRLVAGDSTIVAVQPVTRTARYGEMTVQVLKEHRIRDSLRMDLSAVVRHERVDPLYRSLGASTQADLQSNAVELNGTIGALALAGRFGRTNDNLAGIASILTSRTNQSALTAAMPLSAVIGLKGAWYLPQLALSREGTHQFGDGVPANGEFAESDIPDQANVNTTAALDWTRNTTTLNYRWNSSAQDNRQVGREMADIDGTVHALSLGYAPTEAVNVSLETSRERQSFAETDATQQLHRIGAIARWKVTPLTDLSTNISRSSSEDPAAGVTSNNTELQFEASRAFTLYRMIDNQPQGRVFIRFARVLASQTPQFAGAILSRDLRWTLNAGGSVRFY